MSLPQDLLTLNLPPARWRLLHTPPAAGAWNMAVDEVLLESSVSGAQPPTLRFYAWQPACLSLGYAQPSADADRAALAAQGWQLVRRPTGGRAILHTDELTYSVAGPQNEPRLQGSVLESYRHLAAALLYALQRLEIPAEALPQSQVAPGSDPKGPVCFEVPSNYEITVGGRKLIGSAQSRRLGGVLQHGSLPLYGDLRRIIQALNFASPDERAAAMERLPQRALTAAECLNRRLSWESAAAAFGAAFAAVLNLELLPDELSPAEQARAEQLVQEKYANPAWLERI